MQKHPMTIKGEERLREDLERLKRVDRPQVIQAIAEARAHGDLKENAEYHAAKEQQGFIEAKIRDLESKLSNVHIIDVTKMKNEGKVIFGATVELISVEDAKTLKLQIVGEDEADLKQNKVSFNSPMARAIIGKYEGDEVEVKTPQSTVTYEIGKVEYI